MQNEEEWLNLYNTNNGLGLILTYTKIKKRTGIDLKERKVIFHFFVEAKDIINRDRYRVGTYSKFIGSFWEDEYEEAINLINRFGFNIV